MKTNTEYPYIPELQKHGWFCTTKANSKTLMSAAKEGKIIFFDFDNNGELLNLTYQVENSPTVILKKPTTDLIHNLISGSYEEPKEFSIYRAERAYVEILKSLQKLSTCSRLKVAALLVRDGRIVATGWNGVASGQKHCDIVFKDYTGEDYYDKHHEFSTRYELHAEQNLISFCAKNGIETNNTTIYLTHSPCIHCAKILLSAGVKEVKFLDLYDRDKNGVSLLSENGINCFVLDKDSWKQVL